MATTESEKIRNYEQGHFAKCVVCGALIDGKGRTIMTDEGTWHLCPVHYQRVLRKIEIAMIMRKDLSCTKAIRLLQEELDSNPSARQIEREIYGDNYYGMR